MKTRVEKLLDKLNKGIVDNDNEFLECLIDLDQRLIKEEKKSQDMLEIIKGHLKVNGEVIEELERKGLL